MIRSLLLIIPLSLNLLLTSCGYHVGSMMHPQIKTIGIADVKNDTLEIRASAILRGLLAERFQFDNSLKIVQPEKADIVLYTRIKSIKYSGIVWSSVDRDMTFRPSQFEVSMEIEYSVLRPGYSTPLIAKASTTGHSKFQFTNDPANGKIAGIKQASLRAADSIVIAVTEAW